MNAPLSTSEIAGSFGMKFQASRGGKSLWVMCLTALALLGLAAAPVRAADLAQAYEAALAHDPVLGAARAQLAANEEAVPQTRSLLLPSIGMSGSTNWNEVEQPGGDGFELEFNDHDWGAQLAQPILDMESWYTHSSARASVNAARFNFDATEQELIVRTVQAYLDVLRADSAVVSSQRAEAAAQRQLEQVQQRFDVGLVAITDVLESQAGLRQRGGAFAVQAVTATTISSSRCLRYVDR